MATTKSETTEAEEQIRELAAQFRTYRQRPCLLFVSRHLVYADVAAVRAALEDETGKHLDVLVASPGGDIEAAYLVARELRRRFAALAMAPTRFNAHKNLGLALAGQGQFVEAARCLLEADRRWPGDGRARRHLAELLAAHPEVLVEDLDLATECRAHGLGVGPIGNA